MRSAVSATRSRRIWTLTRHRWRPYHAVFIRAPKITKTAPDVETIAALDDGTVVAARQGRLLATSFHPELTHDDRFHRYFLALGKAEACRRAQRRRSTRRGIRRSSSRACARARPCAASALPIAFAGGTVTGMRRMAPGSCRPGRRPPSRLPGGVPRTAAQRRAWSTTAAGLNGSSFSLPRCSSRGARIARSGCSQA